MAFKDKVEVALCLMANTGVVPEEISADNMRLVWDALDEFQLRLNRAEQLLDWYSGLGSCLGARASHYFAENRRATDTTSDAGAGR